MSAILSFLTILTSPQSSFGNGQHFIKQLSEDSEILCEKYLKKCFFSKNTELGFALTALTEYLQSSR